MPISNALGRGSLRYAFLLASAFVTQLTGCEQAVPTPTTGARLEYRVSLEFGLPEIGNRPPLRDWHDRISRRVSAVSSRAHVRAVAPDRITIDCAQLPDDRIAAIKKALSIAGTFAIGRLAEDQSPVAVEALIEDPESAEGVRLAARAGTRAAHLPPSHHDAFVIVERTSDLEKLRVLQSITTRNVDGTVAHSIFLDDPNHTVMQETAQWAGHRSVVTIDDQVVWIGPMNSAQYGRLHLTFDGDLAKTEGIDAILETPFRIAPKLVEEVRYGEE